MKKILCPRCQVINLEGFVTYPNCAGCGVPLPGAETAAAPAPSWTRRTVPPWLWAGVLGVALLGLGLMAAVAFQAPPPPPPTLLVLGRAPQSVRAGDVFTVSLQVNTLDGPAPREPQPLDNVFLRLPQTMFKAFEVISVQPPPDGISALGDARYYIFHSVKSGAWLHLGMRARYGNRGLHVTTLGIRDNDQQAEAYRFRIEVLPPL